MSYQIFSIIANKDQTIVALPYKFKDIEHMYVSFNGVDFYSASLYATAPSDNVLEFITPLEEGQELTFKRITPAEFTTNIKQQYNYLNLNKELENQYDILNEVKVNFENDFNILKRISDSIERIEDDFIQIGDVEILLEGRADPNKHLLADGSLVSPEQYPELNEYLRPYYANAEIVKPSTQLDIKIGSNNINSFNFIIYNLIRYDEIDLDPELSLNFGSNFYIMNGGQDPVTQTYYPPIIEKQINRYNLFKINPNTPKTIIPRKHEYNLLKTKATKTNFVLSEDAGLSYGEYYGLILNNENVATHSVPSLINYCKQYDVYDDLNDIIYEDEYETIYGEIYVPIDANYGTSLEDKQYYIDLVSKSIQPSDIKFFKEYGDSYYTGGSSIESIIDVEDALFIINYDKEVNDHYLLPDRDELPNPLMGYNQRLVTLTSKRFSNDPTHNYFEGQDVILSSGLNEKNNQTKTATSEIKLFDFDQFAFEKGEDPYYTTKPTDIDVYIEGSNIAQPNFDLTNNNSLPSPQGYFFISIKNNVPASEYKGELRMYKYNIKNNPNKEIDLDYIGTLNGEEYSENFKDIHYMSKSIIKNIYGQDILVAFEYDDLDNIHVSYIDLFTGQLHRPNETFKLDRSRTDILDVRANGQFRTNLVNRYMINADGSNNTGLELIIGASYDDETKDLTVKYLDITEDLTTEKEYVIKNFDKIDHNPAKIARVITGFNFNDFSLEFIIDQTNNNYESKKIINKIYNVVNDYKYFNFGLDHYNLNYNKKININFLTSQRFTNFEKIEYNIKAFQYNFDNIFIPLKPMNGYGFVKKDSQAYNDTYSYYNVYPFDRDNEFIRLKITSEEGLNYKLPDYSGLFSNNAKFYVRYKV